MTDPLHARVNACLLHLAAFHAVGFRGEPLSARRRRWLALTEACAAELSVAEIADLLEIAMAALQEHDDKLWPEAEDLIAGLRLREERQERAA
jgi:hypothetical protein